MIRLIVGLNALGGCILAMLALEALRRPSLDGFTSVLLVGSLVPLGFGIVGLVRARAAHLEGRSHGVWHAYRRSVFAVSIYLAAFTMPFAVKLLSEVIKAWR